MMSMMSATKWWLVPVMASLGACTDTIDLDPLDESPVVEATVRPPPISGGTLVVTHDGTAVAADPDRDLVYVVDVAAGSVRHTIALEPGDEPGRVALGSEGLAHVVLRGAGALATIDLAAGTVSGRRSLCADPRGVAYEAATVTLHVACADGNLLHVPESGDGPIEREMLGADLRDVVVLGNEVWASRFRAAELVASAAVPQGGDGLQPAGEGDFQPHVAWRTWVDSPSGVLPRILMLHQMSSTRPIPIDGGPTRDDGGGGLDGGGGGGGDLPYGGGGSECQPGISGTALTMLSAEEPMTLLLPGLPMAVDAAVSNDGSWVALAVPSAPEGVSSLQLTPQQGLCEVPLAEDSGDGQITAVAFGADGTLVAQSREPAQLVIRSGNPFTGARTIVALSDESRFDTGHEIFHRATESGLSCASCHPEGGDDGHVWSFEQLGPRRTQALDVGLQGTAPFHWDGDMDDLDMIMDEVMSHRMGGNRQSAERRDSFARWLFDQELPPARSDEDATLVQEGEAKFAAFGCASCHAGDRFLSNDTVTVRGQDLQVPSLRRVSLRPPFMHDGRAPTLESAVIDMVDVTRPGIAYTQADVEAISAYLRTL
jgi:mono/diheme cytochrome c family protein